ncbi:TPA: hypothetical protein ACKPY3_000839 [Serratia marcescens]|nr:hypothetical protein [Serratia marcescens]
MYITIFVVLSIVILFSFKKVRGDKHASIRKESTDRILKNELKKAKLYDKRKEEIVKVNLLTTSSTPIEPSGQPKTPADYLNDLLRRGDKVIEVDAELVFKKANFKDNYYLHATHYFPDRECVYGENANGKIVSVDLCGRVKAAYPDTGERIPGVKRYLRQNSI